MNLDPSTTEKNLSLPRPRWWQCDRKTLLVALLLMVAGVGWITYQIVVTHDQRFAVMELEKIGAEIYYDFQWDENNQWVGIVKPGPVQKLFGNVRAVIGNRIEITDDDLIHLNALPKLETLDLTETAITGSGFVDVNELKYLRGLYLEGTGTNDDALEQVARFTNVKDLILSHTPISDVGLEHLTRLNHLESVRLIATNTTADGIGKLKKTFPNCKVVR